MTPTSRWATGVAAGLGAVAIAAWVLSGRPATATTAPPLPAPVPAADSVRQTPSAQPRDFAPEGFDVRFGPTVESQARAPAGATAVFDSARAWEHLRQIVAIGPRPAGSAELRQTRAYIGRQIAGFGLTVQEQQFTASTPVGRVEMSNLVVRLPGRRPDRILFIGHYDTKLLKGQRFVGASDGGSSAAFLVELARVLATGPESSREFTYEFVWLDGEEAFCLGWDECGTSDSPDNTYGSRYYVQAAQKAGAVKSIRAVILVDMIADRDLKFYRESQSTPWLKDIIWGTARSMAYDRVFVDTEQHIIDDHVPFLNAGIPSIDIIDLEYPYWHTPDDTLDRVSARSLQIVGDVVLASLPRIEDHLK